jgi:hypothetical protein
MGFGRAYFGALPRVIDEAVHSGRCVYQAESNHSILSDVSDISISLALHFHICIRHINVIQCTFTTHIRRRYWTIIGTSVNFKNLPN